MKIKNLFGDKNEQKNISGMPETQEITLNKILNAASLVPIEYKYSAKFIEDGTDPLNYEKQRLKGLPADWLMKDKRVPAIKADSRREIELAKRQYINHLYTVDTINSLQEGLVVHVDDMINRLDEEINGYENEITALRARIKH